MQPVLVRTAWSTEKELDARQALYDGTYLRQVRFDSPLWVCIDGRSNKGMVREGKND